jgi:predicted enzyme related to lactoylglutathione lyase
MSQTAGGMDMTFFNAPGGMMGEFSTMSKPAEAMTGPVFFINAASVKAILPNVTAAGGKVYQEEMALPEDWGHIAIIGDSSGNAVGIWSAGE